MSTSIMDGVGHVVRTELQSDPAGTDYTDTTYDGEGRVWKESNPYRSTSDPTYGLTTTAYDALGRVTSITRPDGSIASTSYSGNCSTATDEAGKSRETCSDGLGRMTAVDEDPGGLGYQTTYTYDALDNLLTAVDGGQTRSFTYDSLSRLLSATNPESGTTTYTYDADGNVGTRTDARSVKTTYSYDALNRLTSKSYSDGTPTANYWYDYNWAGFGNWRQGSLTNTKGRLDATCTSNAVAACPAGYTGTVYSYDPMGRIVNYWQATPYDEGTSAWETTYNYDLAGDVTSWTHPAGFTITNTINAAQEITQIESSLADPGHPQYLAKNITYTPWGAEATLENGCASTYGQEIGCTDMLETYAYNNRMQPVVIELGNTSNASANYCLVYNYFAGAANPTSCAMPGQGKNDNGGVGGYVYLDNQTTLSPNLSYTAAFQYDAVNRLMNAQGTGVSPYNLPLSYTADGSGGRYGNVTCAVNAQTQGLCPQYTFNGANNEITTSGFSYDAAGELTDDPSNSPGEAYTWDGAGRLVTITQGADTYANNTYSAQGWQVENVWPIYGNMGQENMYDPTGRELGHVDTANRRWWDADVWADGRMIAQWSTAGTHFLHANSQGTDTQVTNAAGSVTLDMEYDAWGRVPTHTGNMNDGHYAGMEQSAGILYGTPTRQYSSPLGRWLTPDPAGMDAVDLSNPQSWNMYAYALNNPTTNTDPTGLYCTRDSNGNLVDVGNEGESCADVEASNEAEEKNPSVVVRGKPGNVVETVAANAFLSLDNVANDFFAPFIGMRPSYMQDTPTGSGTAANIGALVGIVGSALIGPEGEAEDGISIAEGRLTKVLEAHTAGGLLSAGKSLFDNPDEVRGLIQAARSAPAIEQSGRFAGKFERVVDAGRIIGTDRTGARTSIYTVITDSNGHLVTAFPGRP